MRDGARLLIGGLALALVAVWISSAWLLFAATALAGLGFGGAFNGSVRRLAAAVHPADRAGLMATFYVASYLAFSVPAIAAGVGVGWIGLRAVTGIYGALLLGLTALTLRNRAP